MTPQLAPPSELSREEINQLPLKRFEGPIHVIRETEEVSQAIDAIREESLLGFDTETRPAFKKGTRFPPALVQLAAADSVYLFQISVLGFPSELARILANSEIRKVGVGLDYDLRELQTLADFQPAGFLDLSDTAKNMGLKKVSLRTLAATFLGFRISKSAKCSNWAVRNLRPSQIRYAATDAWVSREIFRTMFSR